MNDINFEREMQKQIDDIRVLGVKPKLLLHACCAPCASSVIERLNGDFDITLYFYNPNMDSEDEYALRAKEIEKLCAYFSIGCVIKEYSSNEFLAVVSGLEKEREGGARCEKCFNLRLENTANFARNNGYKYFATTLTVSPLKNANLLNKTGLEIGERTGVKYLLSDFKKKNGYIRSIELSKELNLYRQNYCGCKFSKKEL